MYNYQVTVSYAASVDHALLGNFISPTQQCLIMSKSTRIEIYDMNSDGLVPLLDLPIYGRIATMLLFRPKNETKDLLFFTTQKFDFCVIAYDSDRGVAVTRANGSVESFKSNLEEPVQIAIVDPECRMIGLHLYEGLFKVIPIDENGQLQQIYDIRMEGGQVSDIKFLYGNSRPTIAVLYQDQRDMRHVKTYEISFRDKEFLEGPWNLPNVEAGASILIPLPLPFGGVLIIGEQSIIYYEGTYATSLATKPSVIKAWGAIGPSSDRILLGDYLGRLWLLVLLHDGANRITDLKLELLTETSCASAIIYLDNGVVFIGSIDGDSQLIKLNSSKDSETGQYVQLLESYTNLGPIVDLNCVSDKQGRAQLISCSGAFKSGTLRIIRNGIGINMHAQLDLPGIQGLWTLKPPSFPHHVMPSNLSEQENMSMTDGIHSTYPDLSNFCYDKYLAVSFIGQTRILGIKDEEMEQVHLSAFDYEQQTIYASTLEAKKELTSEIMNSRFAPNELLLQITSSMIRVTSLKTLEVISEWKPEFGMINVCSANASRITIGSGCLLIIFDVDTSNGLLTEVARTVLDHEIACVDISPLGGHKHQCQRSPLVAVGLWNDISVRILRIEDSELHQVHKERLGGEILPRSILMATLEGVHYLFVALGDGHIFSFFFNLAQAMEANLNNKMITNDLEFDPILSTSSNNVMVTDDQLSPIQMPMLQDVSILTNRKKISLGTHPATLCLFNSRSTSNVFTCSDRPTVIYSRNKKVLYSNANLKEVNCMTELDTSSFPESLAFASDDFLMIGTVDEIQKLHIRTITLNEMVRRICHQPSSNTFLIATFRYECDELTGEELDHNAIRLVHDTTFDILDTFNLDKNEFGESITSVVFTGGTDALYVIGTGYAIPTEHEPTKGRILVFKVVDGNKLTLKSELVCAGSVYCMDAFNGKLVAGIASKVTLFNWTQTSDGINDLKIECEHGNHTQVLCISTKDDLILVGDIMRSLLILVYKPVDGRIEQLANDPRPSWIAALAIKDEFNYLASDNCSNLLSFFRKVDTENEDERERLVASSCHHLGDRPNAIRQGSLSIKLADSDALNLQTFIYGTISGAIGVIATLPEPLYRELYELQDGINSVVKGIGGLSHQAWRGFKKSNKTQNASCFIDGDLIESVLELNKDEQEKIAKSMSMDVDEMIRKIEMIAQATH